jgi:hypothetical protein
MLCDGFWAPNFVYFLLSELSGSNSLEEAQSSVLFYKETHGRVSLAAHRGAFYCQTIYRFQGWLYLVQFCQCY